MLYIMDGYQRRLYKQVMHQLDTLLFYTRVHFQSYSTRVLYAKLLLFNEHPDTHDVYGRVEADINMGL